MIGGIGQLQDVIIRVHRGEQRAALELREFLKEGIRFLLRRHIGVRDVEDEVDYVLAHVTHCIRAGTLRDSARLPALTRAIVQNACSGIATAVEPSGKPTRAKVEAIRRSIATMSNPERTALAGHYMERQTPSQIYASTGVSEARLRSLKDALSGQCEDAKRKAPGVVGGLSDSGGAVA